jgi:NAD(P)-dependent dehydrogenase (short-subunit alcohol dehydrogenase family)
LKAYRMAGEQAARDQRRIQQQVERAEGRRNGKGDRSGKRTQSKGDGKSKKSAAHSQSGTAPSGRTRSGEARRGQPENPLPRQHQSKPGDESELRPAPNYDAPGYLGSEKLQGKVALITGGDSGIGRAVAVLFAREGADVAIVYLCEHDDADETCRAVEREGRRCIKIAGDVRDSRFCEDAVSHTVQELGRLDVLVNNAAFQQHAESLTELTDEHLDMTIRTNLCGYIYMARAALGHLPEGGSIINTGSQTGLFGSKHLLDYSATKGAIHAFTKSLASNVVEKGIRVNVVVPGPVWTPLNPADRAGQEVAEFGSRTQMQRPAQPEEIAPAFVFLASEVCSGFISGIELPITGGTPGGH